MSSVMLLASTPSAGRVVAAAARLCYSKSSAQDLFDGLDDEKAASFLARLRSSGHLSPFEHASFTFAIDGISRVASHQLVRHRLASFSQQSQRYVTMGDPRAVEPKSIADDEEAAKIFDEAVRASYSAYEKMVELGVPKEDARFVLPHGWETSLVVTMNARELAHFFSIRLCRRAQWEIRALAAGMLALALDAAPELFTIAGPSCLAEGACREERSCGRPFSSIEDLIEESAGICEIIK